MHDVVIEHPLRPSDHSRAARALNALSLNMIRALTAALLRGATMLPWHLVAIRGSSKDPAMLRAICRLATSAPVAISAFFTSRAGPVSGSEDLFHRGNRLTTT